MKHLVTIREKISLGMVSICHMVDIVSLSIDELVTFVTGNEIMRDHTNGLTYKLDTVN